MSGFMAVWQFVCKTVLLLTGWLAACLFAWLIVWLSVFLAGWLHVWLDGWLVASLDVCWTGCRAERLSGWFVAGSLSV
jgi:hypothetical protein